MTAVQRAVAGLAAWAAAACIDPGAFECSGDDECASGGAGRCETTGYCSEPDETCESGRRYSRYAGDGLGDSCVADGGGDDGPVPGACGNGELDDGEVCDDGNLLGGDDCNAYCAEPGSALWTVTWDGEAHGDDRAFAVALAPDAATFAVTGFTTAQQGRDVLVQLYDARTAELLWSREHAGDGGLDDMGEQVAFDGDGDIVVAGEESTSAEGGNIWVRKYNPTGGVVWTLSLDGGENGRDRAQSVAVGRSNEVVVAGEIELDVAAAPHTDAWLARFDASGAPVGDPIVAGMSPGQSDAALDVRSDGAANIYATGYMLNASGTFGIWTAVYNDLNAQVWSDTVFPMPEGDLDRGVGITVAANGDVVVAGVASKDIWVQWYDMAGTRTRNIQEDGVLGAHDEAAAVAFADDGSYVVCGFVGFTVDVAERGDVWVRRYSAAGDELWTDIYDGPAREIDKALSVVVEPAGAAIVAGYESGTDQSHNVWIRKYAP